MTIYHFSQALGTIDTQFINEAITFRKRRKRWTKWAAIAACFSVLLVTCFSLVGEPQRNNPQYGNSCLIPSNVTEAFVTHIIAGQTAEYLISGAELDRMRAWANTLQYTPIKAPAQNWYGGESYNFSYNSKDVAFSYFGADENTWFLVIDDSWYAVSNPSRPLPEIIDGHQFAPLE